MKKLLYVVLFLASLGVFAQQVGTIKGIIIDEETNGQPMQMAQIELKGTSHIVQSNFFGDFEIADVEPGNYELQITFAGYQTVVLPLQIEAEEVITIQQGLVAESISIEELLQLAENSGNTASLNSNNTLSTKE